MSQQIEINLSETSSIECANCHNTIFSEVIMLRKVSRFLTRAAQDGVMPVPIFVCQKCGAICPDALAPQVRDMLIVDAQSISEEPITPDQGSRIIQMPVR